MGKSTISQINASYCRQSSKFSNLIKSFNCKLATVRFLENKCQCKNDEQTAESAILYKNEDIFFLVQIIYLYQRHSTYKISGVS
jgi:hypothetical protein